jgi:hypothetical protein
MKTRSELMTLLFMTTTVVACSSAPPAKLSLTPRVTQAASYRGSSARAD